jgi:hypothetical protein
LAATPGVGSALGIVVRQAHHEASGAALPAGRLHDGVLRFSPSENLILSLSKDEVRARRGFHLLFRECISGEGLP